MNTSASNLQAKIAAASRRASPLLWWGLLLTVVYAGVLTALWRWQERLLFHPEPLPANFQFDVSPDVHERWIEVSGTRLNALYLQLPRPKGVVFYLHGNGGNLATWFTLTDFYREANFDLFMIDYRGYGKSGGRIDSEAQLHADVRAAWRALATRYVGLRQVVLGRSLGTGLAANLAAEVQPDLTVLVSPYASMRQLAAEHYPWVPGAVLRYPLRTDLDLPRLAHPVLLLHGADDSLIPPLHSNILADLSPEAKLIVIPAAGHNDIHLFPGYLDSLRKALEAL